MEYNDLKQALLGCSDLAGLDESSIALLLWRAQHLTVPAGVAIYTEGDSFDETFCLLLSGFLSIERGEVVLGEIPDRQIFGEMAYFTRLHARTATVRVASPEATVLKFELTPAELGSLPFFALKRYLGLQAWDRFVSNSQNLPFLAASPSLNQTSPPNPEG
jgi:hypothetical protein